jgi:hypothetical protein
MSDKTAPAPLLTKELEEFLGLLKEADSLELKLTVPDVDRRSAAQALGVDTLNARIRQVYFFDTPDLALDRSGVVVRARRTQAAPDDTVVKLRPVVPADVPKELRDQPDFKVEVDAMPDSFVCSASFRGAAKTAGVADVAAGRRPLRKLFSKAQRSFFGEHAPAGVELDDLRVLGPVHAFKLKVSPEGLRRRLAVELWLYPDGSQILELSTKSSPADWFDAVKSTRDFLVAGGLDLTAEQSTKTRTALEYFAGQLD